MKFFIVCPPKLEKYCLKELQNKWPLYFDSDLEAKLVSGGIEVSADMEEGLALNHILRGATRILLRIKEQRCKDIPKLYNIIKKIPWRNYTKREKFNFKITSHKSRLINTTKMEKACEGAISDYFRANALSQKTLESHSIATQTIYIRVDNDDLTISLDCSGELLHKRKKHTFKGHASIRENIAYLLLQELLKVHSPSDLIDPMCGSGTFLLEAHYQNHLNERSFPYEDWHTKIKLNPSNQENPFSLIGKEIDQGVCQKVSEYKFLEIKNEDLFKASKQIKKDSSVIINPPYGKRIKIKEDRNIFFQKVLESIFKTYYPTAIGMIIPQGVKQPVLKEYQKVNAIPFNNSGIKCEFLVFKLI